MQISMRGIRKCFGATAAVEDVSLEVRPGEIHALLGENGAGKTTLMNILYGLHHADAGSIVVDGAAVDIQSPKDAIDLGIGMIHQHFMLTPAFTVAENLILGEQRADRWWLDRRALSKEIRAFAQQHGSDVNPDAPVRHLPVGTQQRVEILKALWRGARTLILDEPTAVLTPQETENLFTILRRFREDGNSIIFISHKLGEVMALCDRVTVLHHGKVVGVLDTDDTSPDDLTRMMVGQEIERVRWQEKPTTNKVVVAVQHLPVQDEQGLDGLVDVSFEIHAGEILGVAGVDGNGQRELADSLMGLCRVHKGCVVLHGVDITNQSVKERYARNVSYIPQDRQATGLILGFSVEENLILNQAYLTKYSRGGALDTTSIRSHARQLIERFDIRVQNSGAAVSTLSGGNQQKVVFARELAREPDFLVAFNPARGIDIQATNAIHQRLLERREAGAGVLLMSTDLDEVLALSDRIAVMLNGRLVDIVPSGTSRQVIGKMMVG
ncbi:MAG: ABC transporter ATP-binding protein [Gemmatimonadota bacterium]|nr:ABC transporter ATP-binding protein [Gemmatimonadota bacterium]